MPVIAIYWITDLIIFCGYLLTEFDAHRVSRDDNVCCMCIHVHASITVKLVSVCVRSCVSMHISCVENGSCYTQ